MAEILVVDDDQSVRASITMLLVAEGHEVLQAANGKDGLRLLEKQIFDLVLCDLVMDDVDGITVLKQAKAASPDVEVIMMTAFGSIDSAVEAMRNGASHYITKPFKNDELLLNVRNALEKNELRMRVRRLELTIEQKFGVDNVIAANPRMQEIIKKALAVASTDSSILINGESGTGKEVLAHMIHNASKRRDKPFIPVNCAAMPEQLLESELFGHIKGAFTSAIANKRGLAEEADGGTLFLDEIAETSLSFQAKLLRFTQSGEVRRLGESVIRRVNVRLISATNKNLMQAVTRSTFREDLFYRMAVIPIEIPPLRERTEDISILAQHFLRDYAQKSAGEQKRLTKSAINAMLKYKWPGNVRELVNAIEYACAVSESDVIKAEDLPQVLREATELAPGFQFESGKTLDEVCKQYIIHVLQDVDWNQKAAREILNVSKATLYRKLKDWGIHPKVMAATSKK